MKKFLAVSLAAFFAIALAGCGSSSSDSGGYSPIIPTPVPTPDPTPQPEVDTSEKIIFSGNIGAITDVCIDSTGTRFFFPLNNGVIKCYDRITGETKDIKTSATNIFSVCYADGRIYFTERATRNVCFINEDGTGETTVNTPDSANRIDIPGYIRYGGGYVVGTDFGYSTSGAVYCIDPASAPSEYVKYNVSGMSKPLDITFRDGVWMTANYNATDSYAFYAGNPASSAWTAIGVTGKYIMSPAIDIPDGGTPSVAYSAMDNTGTSIRKMDLVEGTDSSLVTDGSIPHVYKIVKSEVGNKYYFTSMGNANRAGVYMMDIDGKNVERISESTMYYPAMLVVNDKRTDLPDGYEEIVWTTTGSDIDKGNASFDGGNGHVYSKIIKVR